MVRNALQKDFDREVQKCKRRYWCREQEHLRDIQRRALAQFRAGVAPLALETGRYLGLPVRERICFHCKSLNRETVEDEKHVILTCPLYNAQRATLFTRLEESIQGFSYISEEQKFKTILSDGNNVKQCASFLKTILEIRRSELMKPQGH